MAAPREDLAMTRLPVSFWPCLWSALSQKHQMLASYLHTKTPPALAPQWVRFFCKSVCTWPGEGTRTRTSCLSLMRQDCVIWGCVLPSCNGWQPLCFKLCFSVFCSFRVLELLVLFFKRNIYNWIALQYSSLGCWSWCQLLILFFQDSLPLLNWH